MLTPYKLAAAGAPSITTQPQDQSVIVGSNAVFTVAASGQTPFFYRWSVNGTNLANNTRISGATNATLTISNVVAADGGNYQVVVSNSHGGTASSNAVLMVLVPAFIAIPPSNQVVTVSGNAAFSVVAGGTIPLSYRWYFNGAPLTDAGRVTGSATANLNIANVQMADAGFYQVSVSNQYGAVMSAGVVLGTSSGTPGTVRYVNVNSTSPAVPYTDWSTAATNIQDAIDVSTKGDFIFVTNGVYQIGGRATTDGTTNRVVVASAVTLQSVNGSAATLIDGGQSMRCIYLTNGAALVGFTLTNGSAGTGAGVMCSGTNVLLVNCWIVNNTASSGGGAYSGTLTNCTLSGNSCPVSDSGGGGALNAILFGCTLTGNVVGRSYPNETVGSRGGGAAGCLLNNCTLTGNSANGFGETGGGGADNSTLNNCTVSGNYTDGDGGGTFGCNLNYCTISNNRANGDGGGMEAGGVTGGLVNHCLISGNTAAGSGGGADYAATLNYCTLTGNFAGWGAAVVYCTLNYCYVTNNQGTYGVGQYYSTLNNCLVANNSGYQGVGGYMGTFNNCIIVSNAASYEAGGEYNSTLNNCINYYNTAATGYYPNNQIGSLNYCCTPDAGGTGCIANEPLFVNLAGGDFHLQSNSPCINAGNNAYVNSLTDLDGVPRIIDGAVDMGAYEFPTPGYLVIQAQPQSQSAIAERTVTFNVTAASPLPMSYKWQFNGTNLPGASNTNLVLSNVQSNNAGWYAVVISNGVNTVLSSNALLSVSYPPPQILSQPSDLTVITGSNVVFSCVATSYFSLQFQWQVNGTNLANGGRISGATNFALTIANSQPADAGAYQAVVYDRYGNALTSSIANLTVLGAPGIQSQPQDAVVPRFVNCSLSVTVTGAPPFFYQWRKDRTNLTDNASISGSGASTLAISNVQYADVGQYDVAITNVFGAVTSNPVMITVVPVVDWGWDPFNITGNVPASSSNAVSISAGNYHDLALLKDGTVIGWGVYIGYGDPPTPPASLSNIVSICAATIHDLALLNDGTVVAWGHNDFGQLNVPAGLNDAVAVAAGANHSLALRSDGTVLAWGDNGFGQTNVPTGLSNAVAIAAAYNQSYALLSDGTVVAWGEDGFGEVNVPTGLSNVVSVAAGAHHALALCSDGTVVAWGYNAYGQTDVPAGLSNVVAVTAGDYHSLALQYGGVMVGWGNNMGGQTTVPAPGLTNLDTFSAGGYHSLALEQNPFAPVPPEVGWQGSFDRRIPAGRTTILNPYVTGSEPLRFQWYLNGASLGGQTNRWLALVSVGTNQAGNYQLVVTNNFGAVTGQVVAVAVTPGIVTEPVSQIAFTGNSATFTTTSSGPGPFTYQWYFSGTPLINSAHISGSMTASLTVSNIQMSDAGNYVLVVANSVGSTATMAASLGVASQPTNQTILQGNGASISTQTNSSVPILFQWLENGIILTNGGRMSGVTNSVLVISGAQTTDSGAYQVIAVSTNSSLSATSAVASLTVLAPAVITGQPSSQAVLLGGTATFTAAAAGSSLNYQWLNNGVPLSDNGHISGSATPTLTVFNVQSGDAGGYVFMASNALSSAASLTAALTPLTMSGPSVRYVNVNNTNPMTPYLNWNTAATNIQDAIDAAVDGDSITVTDGVYQVGGRVVYGSLTNRVAINKAVTVQSVNGAAATIIRGNRPQGNNAVRCVYLTNNAALSGFTLLGGGTRTSGDLVKEECGGGAWCESTNARLIGCLIVSNVALFNGGGECFGTLSNCTLAGNSATNGSGGGTYFGILNQCVLTNNFAQLVGGGACSNILNACTLTRNISRGNPLTTSGGGGGAVLSRLNGCLLTGNLSANGGGAAQSTLINCIISSNTASATGGGVLSCTLNNCLVVGNTSTNYGGGAISSTLNNCLVWANHSFTSGGGAQGCNLNNCTVTGNSGEGTNGLAGVYSGTARNCIIYYNIGQNSYVTSMTNCCTIPLSVGGSTGPNNFTNAPQFADPNSDFHLQSNSPCINSGNNAFVAGPTDLDGRPRIVNGTVDVGADEFQGAGYDSFIAWLQKSGLPTDGSADYTDSDGDGMNNYQEWLAGTDPSNSASVLRMLTPSWTNTPPGIAVSWLSISNRTYFLERSSDLGGPPMFLTVAANIPGQPGVTTYIDTNAVGFGPFFYRVGIQTASNVLSTPFSVISFAWLQQYGLPTDGSVDYADLDGTGMNVYQDWVAGLDPTNSVSILAVFPPVVTTNSTGLTVSWQSVNTRTYFLQRSGNLAAPQVFSTIASNIAGRIGTTSYSDTTATNGGPYFYRVGVY